MTFEIVYLLRFFLFKIIISSFLFFPQQDDKSNFVELLSPCFVTTTFFRFHPLIGPSHHFFGMFWPQFEMTENAVLEQTIIETWNDIFKVIDVVVIEKFKLKKKCSLKPV